MKVKLKDEQQRWHELEQRREHFQRSWINDKNLKEMHVECL